MLFVTVGTTYFDELIETVDTAIGLGQLVDPDVVLQIGHGGKYVPKHCRYLRIAPTLLPFYQAADLVVGHGGTGTTIEVLMLGKPLVSVANPHVLDNHQDEFLTAMESEGFVSYCRDLTRVPQAINARRVPLRPILPATMLAETISRELTQLYAPRPQKRSWFDRIAHRFIQRCEVTDLNVTCADDDDQQVWKLLIDPHAASAPAAAPTANRP